MARGSAVEDLELEERLRLFHFVMGPDRRLYLAVLHVFDRARRRYQVQLNTDEVLAALTAEGLDFPEPDRVRDLLDALTAWKVLHRAHDSGRVATIAEYRRRNSVYQLTEFGFLAFSAVDGVIRAKPSDAELRRLAFPAILADLEELHGANAAGDAGRVNLLLDRLNVVLTSLADRAARFHLMIGELAQAHDARPELYLRHKDLLLVHLTDFLVELQRYRPRIAAAVLAVDSTGVDKLVENAVASDTAVFLTIDEKQARWRSHWEGIHRWFIGVAGAPSTAEQLDALTARAISDLLSLLRRVMHARRGGVSRESQLQFLAAWFSDLVSDSDAHALFVATWGIRAPRHISVEQAEVDQGKTGRSWWSAPPVELSTTLRELGKTPSPGRPGTLRDNSVERAAARELQRLLRDAEAQAAARLAAHGVEGRVLDRDELKIFLRLLDGALQSRSAPAGAADSKSSAILSTSHVLGAQLTLRANAATSTIETVEGSLRTEKLRVDVGPRGDSRAGEDRQ